MSFDIEKMKADGVSEHLIYLASVEPEVLMIRVARRLENDRLFQQFMGETASEIGKIYPYAVAAGLMSEADRKWLVDAGNPYTKKFTVTFVSDGISGKITAWGKVDDETGALIDSKPNPYLANAGEEILLPEIFEIDNDGTKSLSGVFIVDGDEIGGSGDTYIVEKDVTIELGEPQE